MLHNGGDIVINYLLTTNQNQIQFSSINYNNNTQQEYKSCVTLPVSILIIKCIDMSLI